MGRTLVIIRSIYRKIALQNNIVGNVYELELQIGRLYQLVSALASYR